MTIQLPPSAQCQTRPTESTKPDIVEPAASVGAVPAGTGMFTRLRIYRRLSEAVARWRLRAVAAPLTAETTHGRTRITALALHDISATALALAAPVTENPRDRLSEVPDVGEIGNRPGLSEAAFQPGTSPRWSHH